MPGLFFFAPAKPNSSWTALEIGYFALERRTTKNAIRWPKAVFLRGAPFVSGAKLKNAILGKKGAPKKQAAPEECKFTDSRAAVLCGKTARFVAESLGKSSIGQQVRPQIRPTDGSVADDLFSVPVSPPPDSVCSNRLKRRWWKPHVVQERSKWWQFFDTAERLACVRAATKISLLFWVTVLSDDSEVRIRTGGPGASAAPPRRLSCAADSGIPVAARRLIHTPAVHQNCLQFIRSCRAPQKRAGARAASEWPKWVGQSENQSKSPGRAPLGAR